MAESDMRRKVVKGLSSLDAIPVENGGCWPGTPDIAYIGGWIECKWLRKWPTRKSTIVKLDHELNAAQRYWGKTHWKKGGLTFVLLQCRRDWLLFTGPWAASYLGHVPLLDDPQSDTLGLESGCLKWWTQGIDFDELKELITRRP